MVHGFQQWQDACWHQACPLQTMRGVQTHSTADVARELDSHWAVHRNVRDKLDYRAVCAHWVPKNPLDDDDAHCLGLYGPAFLVSFGHGTLIKESSFGAATWLIT